MEIVPMADKPKQKTKSQHTVPRCYLRGFADANESFFSFNKRYQHTKIASVGQSAQADYFYDFDPTTLQNPDDDPQWAESMFASLEKRFKEVLDEFIAGAMTGEVGIEPASYLAQFIAIQWLRTRGARDTLMEIDVKARQEFISQWYKINHPGMPPAKFRTGAGYAQALHAETTFDYDRLMKIAEKFWNLIWVIGRNRTDHPFYTSDEPVARRQNPVVNCTLLPVPPGVGIEYAFPLNSELVLTMFDRRMFRMVEQFERKTVDFGIEEVERYNTMQVMKSTQYVFCAKRDFELAERLCKAQPEICDPNRERAHVDLELSPDGIGNIEVVLPE
jgi:Protein of unknown function (DUF4238)